MSDLVKDGGRAPTSQENRFVPRPATLCRLTRKSAHALVDVSIDATQWRPTPAVGEVVRPAEQDSIQSVAYFWLRLVIAGPQQVADRRFEPLHALLGRSLRLGRMSPFASARQGERSIPSFRGAGCAREPESRNIGLRKQ